MRVVFRMASVALMLTMTSISQAANITTLLNTGMHYSTAGDNTTGTVLTNGAAEENYKLVGKPAASTSDLIAVTASGGFPIPPWLGDNSTSAWIRPNNNLLFQSNQSDPDGTYKYRTTFDLTGWIAATTEITGRWSTDNPGLQIRLNGNVVAPPSTTPNAGFNTWTSFSFSASNPSNIFLHGVNTLEFWVSNIQQNFGNPTGLRVELSGDAKIDPSGGPTVPLPASLLLLITGIPGLGLVVRRLKKSV